MSARRRPLASSQPHVAAGLVVLLVWEAAAQPRPPGDAREPYLQWALARQAELKKPGLSESERRLREVALTCFGMQAYAPDVRPLRATTPERLYRTCWLEAKKQEREEAERAVAVEAKLDEYLRWALRVGAETPPKFRQVGPDLLLTEAPEVGQSRDMLVRSVLRWALTHTEDPAFLARSPSEVALYLLARESALAAAVHLGTVASPRVEYTPVGEEPADFPEVAAELLVGFVPGVGQVVLVLEAVVGINMSGRLLKGQERLVVAIPEERGADDAAAGERAERLHPGLGPWAPARAHLGKAVPLRRDQGPPGALQYG